MSALQSWVEGAATGIELLAVAFIVITIAFSTLGYLGRLTRGLADDTTYKSYRHQLARALLLGLELLVAADIIRTVALEPTLMHVVILGPAGADPEPAELEAGGGDRGALAVAAASIGARTGRMKARI